VWVLGRRWYRPLPDGRIVAVRTNGGDEVVVLDAATQAASPLGLDAIGDVSIEDIHGTRVVLTGAGASTPTAVWVVDLDHPDQPERVAGGSNGWDAAWTPRARAVTFEGTHGPVHAFEYPPTSPHTVGPEGERPPYLVLVHGGPTSHTAPTTSAKTAFFTSRGIGVLDVNYGGSTGYGRAYRERLRGQWGVVDVDDVAAAAAGLAAAGRADATRLAIDGGSAGGWTVLAALTNTDVFAAGISRYGVGDARALAADTHDFEARYLDGLIGPLPEAEDLYRQRSPLSRPERFRVPVLLLQGADDPVVPPAQAEAIQAALAERGIPHAYVLYEGEGHGFRRTQTVIDALEKELAFLGAVFGFTPADVAPLALS
jgi:dipeptidyl aminopeptidase/acylaminoacyl peptidase